MRNRKGKIMACLLAVLLLAMSCSVPAAALTEKARTVRVAYPIQKGLTDFNEYGNRTGYTYEYLEEIAQYTGWEYEFVEAEGDLNDSLTTLMEMLDQGEVDLMGAMTYSESLGERYDYSSHSYGTGETVLQIPFDCVQDIAINSKEEQSFRIAVVNTTGMRVRELEDYCRMNLIIPEYVVCDSLEEQVQAVRDGRADMFLNSSLNYVKNVRIVARFSPAPFYFVTTKGKNSQLMEELNSAIISIEQADPLFSTALYEKYFVSQNSELTLSETEQEYIAQGEPVKVGVLEDQPPYQYLNQNSGEMSGIALGMLDYITEKTGLAFEVVPAATQEKLFQMVKNGQVDMVAGMSYDYDMAQERGLSMSRPYLSAGYILMMNESTSEDNLLGRRLAMTTTSAYKGETLGDVVRFETVRECVRAVADGSADYTYLDIYTAQYYINQPNYHNLKLVAQSYSPRKLCFGVVKPGSQSLLSILNKTVTTISEEESQGIVNQNILHKDSFSLMDLILENPVQAILVLVAVFLIIICFLLYILWQRVRMNRRSALELEKHFRVYALVNEYFFEYNFKLRVLLVSVPPREAGAKPVLRRFDCGLIDSGVSSEFLEIVRSGKDGPQETELTFLDGVTHWARIALDTVYDGDTPAYALGKINIIDEEKQELDTLLDKANRDSLTQLYNAETAHTMIQGSIARLKEGEFGGLILVDVDHFKAINDTYGHLRGDETLQHMAEILTGCVRENDVVGRPGGDEFCVYLHGIRDAGVMAAKCAAIGEKARGFRGEDGLTFTCSVGASLVSPGEDYQAAYRRTDEAMYEAKRQGRDRYCLADRH